jgi:hypothetical protein
MVVTLYPAGLVWSATYCKLGGDPAGWLAYG